MTDARRSAAVSVPSWWLDAALLAGRTARTALRDIPALTAALLFPLVLMLLMSAGFAQIVLPGQGFGAYLDYSLPLFVVMGVAFASLDTGVRAHADLGSGFEARLRAMPVARVSPMLGRVLGDLGRNLLIVVTVTGVGLALGFRFRTDVLGVLGFLVLPLVLGIGLGWLMVALAAWASSGEAVASMMNALLLVLSFLSTGFVPLAALPGWAQPIAAVNPLSVTVEGARALSQGGPSGVGGIGTVVWVLVLVAVTAPVAIRGRERKRPASRASS